MRINHKSISLTELKLAQNATGLMEFSGYGAVFGNVDSYGDVIQKGAFSAYLADAKAGIQQYPALLSQHGGWGMGASDMTPIGVWSSLEEDDVGLKLTGVLADTERGKEAYTLLKMQPRPAISGLSIGYYTRNSVNGGKQDSYDRLLTQVDLIEISLVTFPANDKARVNGVKSALEDLTDRDFERLMQDAGLSRKEARIVMNHGFRHLKAMQDAGDDTQDAVSGELKALADALSKNIKHLTI